MSGVDLFLPKTRTTREARARALEDAADVLASDTPPDDIAPTTWREMRRFNERLADPERYFSIMIPTQEGMTVAVKLF